MSLKELSHEKRILFLLEFVAELVTHSAEDERLKRLIKVERIKRKLLPEPEPNLEPIGKSIIFEEPSKQENKSPPPRQLKHKVLLRPRMKTPMIRSKQIVKQKPMIKQMPQSLGSNHETKNTEELMGQLNKLIYDRNVQMIECPGPGRNILVKVRNNVNATKMILNEAEIKNIVMYYSDIARIPIVGGILKASIESMMITAVVSDYAGSRFIISKRSPYDLIS